MSPPTDDIGRAAQPPGGHHSSAFARLGELVVRRPVVVILCWIALAAALLATLPSLNQMVLERPVDLLPADAPVMVTTAQMTDAFDESGSQNVLVVVLEREDGMRPADEATYRQLADRLRGDTRDVVMVQDFVATPPLREAMASADGKAYYLAVGLTGDIGTPAAYEAYTGVEQIVAETVTDPGLTSHLTGPSGTVADLTAVGERDLHAIEIATAVMVLTILLIVYRNAVTMALPLATIGVSLVVAQQLVAGMSALGLGLSNQTITFLTGMLVGAGVDYAVFLISRYHEYLRLGETSDRAVVKALASIGKVIAASAATVAVTFLGMMFTKLGLFATIGPALAVAIAVAFLAAVTLLPALLALAGRRGWVRPRRDLTTRFWRRSGIHIVRRPAAHLVASLVVLAVLAGCAGLVRFNFDDRSTLPADVGSNQGYAAMDRHFPVNATIPQYLFISSPHDLRTPEALADLEQLAQRVSQVPGVAAVRGITRPTGETLEQAKTTHQAGEVGAKLAGAATTITDRTADLDTLAGGADTLADRLGEVRGGVAQAVVAIRGLVDALSGVSGRFGGGATLAQLDHAAELLGGMRALGATLQHNLDLVSGNLRWAAPVLTALEASPVCDADPACGEARGELQRLVRANDDGSLDQLADLARQLTQTTGTQTLAATARGLGAALDRATGALRRLGLGDPGAVQSRLNELQRGADTLADASRRLADGVTLLVDQTKSMGSGLGEASAFLLAMKRDARAPSMSGFYIPPAMLAGKDFTDAAAAFISPDGHGVRYLVQTELNPFSTAAMDQVDAVVAAARSAQPNTALADASVSMAGFPATLRDMRNFYYHDLTLIVAVTVLVVLLILVLLLRAVVAPLYLIGSVIISYLSALGIGVLFFQYVLGDELSWSVPGMTFIVLVAVGADYNLLLISRIRDESPHGVRSGVIKTVGSTGGVITSAGVIFAASMFGLLFGGIATMVQAGFIIGVGLLLDTFLVRTVTVPAIAVLVGRANWWPSRWQPARR
ncbi:RND family transporter [Mycobacterium sp. MYCO198283]|uniref:MMPL/RND family transporter n=1 Tax=Mycobacterium sp. MYCO198283 TaxID=2883505 RepID=UPI0035ABE2F5